MQYIDCSRLESVNLLERMSSSSASSLDLFSPTEALYSISLASLLITMQYLTLSPNSL